MYPLGFRSSVSKCAILCLGPRAGDPVLLATLPGHQTPKDKRAITTGRPIIYNRSGKIGISVDLHNLISTPWEKQALPRAAFQVCQYPIGGLSVDLMRSMHELTEKMNRKADVRSSNKSTSPPTADTNSGLPKASRPLPPA